MPHGHLRAVAQMTADDTTADDTTMVPGWPQVLDSPALVGMD
jgi:hypothetical protein